MSVCSSCSGLSYIGLGRPEVKVRSFSVLLNVGHFAVYEHDLDVGVNVELLGYAAHVDAGTAHVAVFRHGDFRTETRGHARGAHSARSGTDHKQVVVHFPPSSGPLAPGGVAILAIVVSSDTPWSNEFLSLILSA